MMFVRLLNVVTVTVTMAKLHVTPSVTGALKGEGEAATANASLNVASMIDKLVKTWCVIHKNKAANLKSKR